MPVWIVCRLLAGDKPFFDTNSDGLRSTLLIALGDRVKVVEGKRAERHETFTLGLNKNFGCFHTDDLSRGGTGIF